MIVFSVDYLAHSFIRFNRGEKMVNYNYRLKFLFQLNLGYRKIKLLLVIFFYTILGT